MSDAVSELMGSFGLSETSSKRGRKVYPVPGQELEIPPPAPKLAAPAEQESSHQEEGAARSGLPAPEDEDAPPAGLLSQDAEDEGEELSEPEEEAEPSRAKSRAKQKSPAAPVIPSLVPESELSSDLPGEQELISSLTELGSMLSRVEDLKKRARSIEDWRVMMLYIAGCKPRISELTARAKRLHAEQYGEAWDRQYAFLREVGGRAPNLKTVEIRAKRASGLSGEAADRLERTWRDLQDLMWAAKSVADGMQSEHDSPQFTAYPDHMFED